MKAAFDQNYVKNLHGTHVKKGKTKFDLAEQIREDIRDFKKKNKLDRLVMVWCASTEVFMKPEDVHKDLASFEKAMKANHPAIAPSMLYAYAAISEGVPFANGAPNLTVDIPALEEYAKAKNVPIGGKDFKTGQTLMKTVLAPAFKARMLGPERMVFDEYSGQSRWRSARRSRLVQDQGRIEARRARIYFAAEDLSGALRQNPPQGAHQLLSAARRQQRRLGQHRHFRLARLSDADQSGFPVPRFDSGRADRPGPGAVFRSREARGHARHSGMAQLLLQISDVRAASFIPSTTSSSSR